MWYQVTWCDVMWCDMMWYDITWYDPAGNMFWIVPNSMEILSYQSSSRMKCALSVDGKLF